LRWERVELIKHTANSDHPRPCPQNGALLSFNTAVFVRLTFLILALEPVSRVECFAGRIRAFRAAVRVCVTGDATKVGNGGSGADFAGDIATSRPSTAAVIRVDASGGSSTCRPIRGVLRAPIFGNIRTAVRFRLWCVCATAARGAAGTNQIRVGCDGRGRRRRSGSRRGVGRHC
jgi:hypothetical protein